VIKSIVVGTDGSETAECAVERAVEIAEPLGAKAHLVSAYEQSAAKAGGGFEVSRAEWMVSPGVTVESVLERAVGLFKVKGIETETYARKGDPADAILEVAQQVEADLIVVGSKGMRGAKRFLLGSVPNKISHEAPCDVMIVRTH
jgi:nucleotide-binding universal stress UspA family protein